MEIIGNLHHLSLIRTHHSIIDPIASFELTTDEYVQMVMDRLNNRPRKTLGFKTPNDVFFQSVTKQAA